MAEDSWLINYDHRQESGRMVWIISSWEWVSLTLLAVVAEGEWKWEQ